MVEVGSVFPFAVTLRDMAWIAIAEECLYAPVAHGYCEAYRVLGRQFALESRTLFNHMSAFGRNREVNCFLAGDINTVHHRRLRIVPLVRTLLLQALLRLWHLVRRWTLLLLLLLILRRRYKARVALAWRISHDTTK